MKNLSKLIIAISLAVLVFLGACSGNSAVKTADAPDAPLAPNVSTQETTAPEKKGVVIYAPATTSSIPIILATGKMEDAQLTLYTNQSQANTLFLRGDVDLLVTGISVGVDMVRNDAPVQMVNAFVSGLSYLVTSGNKVNNLAELKGEQITFPFKGSPLEEVTAHFAKQSGLTWESDLTPQYTPFESSVEMLKQGKARAVVLPEPNVTLLEGQPGINISLSYYDLWNSLHPGDQGYPQVGTFVKSDWAKSHDAQIAQYNQALAEAITAVEKDQSAAIEQVKDNFKLPAAKLLKSLNRTRYHLISGTEMQDDITKYYAVIEKPLNENFAAFYYLPAK